MRNIKYHFIREQVNSGKAKLEYCASDEMVTDIFTEALCHEHFSKLRNKARIMEKP